MRTALFLLSALALTACGKTEPKNSLEDQRAERERTKLARSKEACASNATYDRLKQVAFDEAIRIKNADPVNLDILSTHAMVRVEEPVVAARDDALDVTVCRGEMVLHIPPGAERAFAGKRQLEADVEYRAQAAADGSGMVFQLKGAEPIIRELAAFDLKGQRYRPPQQARPTETLASAQTEAPTREPGDTSPARPAAAPPPPARVRTAAPAPRPSPTRTAVAHRTAAPQPAPTRTASAQRSSAAPSFNCRYARTRSERMVCGSGELAALDRTMSSQFYSALSRGDERTRAELRRSRDRFLARRDRCGDEACVARTYAERMNEIDDIAGR